MGRFRCLIDVLGLGIFLTLSSIYPILAESSCPAERAIYTMETEDGAFSASFVPAHSSASMASDLYLRLTTPQRAYWFVLALSSGYGGTTLLPVSDPYHETARENGPRNLLDAEDMDAGVYEETLSNLRFYALDETLNFIEEPPASEEPAPAFIMMPELVVTLWYDPSAVSEDPTAERDPMPRGIFRFGACLDNAPSRAWP